MKIIFIDADGPLTNERTQAQTGDWYNFDPVACQALNNICEASDTKIVFISSRSYKSSTFYNEIKSLLIEAGFNPENLHPDWTVNDKDERDEKGKLRSREELITRWANRNPEFTHYCIVDDENVDLPNLVQVSERDGILSEHFYAIAHHLDIDLKYTFQKARESRGDFFETQYQLPFHSHYSDWNKGISGPN